MKEEYERFIRIISPLTVITIFIADIAVIFFAVFAVKKLMQAPSGMLIIMALLELMAIVVAVLVTKQIFSEGIAFREDEFEFIGLDDKNVFEYENIYNVTYEKDTKVSFVKNFIDRHSIIYIEDKNHDITSIDIGLTTKYTTELVAKEICERCGINFVPHKPDEKFSFKKKKQNNNDNENDNDNNN